MRPPALLFSFALVTGCGTVDLGDNFAAPELNLDEDFFFCRIQPEVIARSSCASGDAGEAGNCHSAKSALRLETEAETVARPTCENGVPTQVVPDSYRRNLERVRFTVQVDPLASPFYRRPTGLDSHPRTIFSESSEEARLIVDWIAGGAM